MFNLIYVIPFPAQSSKWSAEFPTVTEGLSFARCYASLPRLYYVCRTIVLLKTSVFREVPLRVPRLPSKNPTERCMRNLWWKRN